MASILRLDQLQSLDGSNAIQLTSGGNINVQATGSFATNLQLPNWTTAGRPSAPPNGSLGVNTDTGFVEVYTAGTWINIGGGALGTYNNPATSGNQLNSAGYETGYYWIQPSGSLDKKYCYVDNTNYGGGWVLVQTVGSGTGYHSDRTTEFNLVTTTDKDGNVAQTVPFSGELYSSANGNRFSDDFVKTVGAAANGGEEVFNLRMARNGAQPKGGPNDTWQAGTNADWRYAAFVRYDNGLSGYSSNNNGGGTNPPIDISHYYPYQWETGGSGHFVLFNSNYRVFDMHSNPSSIQSSRYSQNRFLWSYPGAGAAGIYGASDSFNGGGGGNPGYMFIR